MYFENFSKSEILKIYEFVMKIRKDNHFGQRKIFRLVKEKFGKEIKESTIANWIFLGNIPFGNEKTQFKPLQIPKKEEITELYLHQNQSAQKIAKIYGVSTAIILNWIKLYEIKKRTHLESMNTPVIKKELRDRKLKNPTKEFVNLSPEKAYLLGVLCGDGHIKPGVIRLEIRYDEEFIKEFSDCLKKVYGLDFKYYYYKKRNSFVLYASCESVYNDLLRYGEFGTRVWKVPKEILTCDDEKITTYFLRGFCDSEACVTKYSVGVSSINQEGIEGISFLLQKLGIKNKIYVMKREYYVDYITKKDNLKLFSEKIGFTIKRKRDKLNWRENDKRK